MKKLIPFIKGVHDMEEEPKPVKKTEYKSSFWDKLFDFSDTDKNFRDTRRATIGNISSLREVCNIKRRTMRGY